MQHARKHAKKWLMQAEVVQACKARFDEQLTAIPWCPDNLQIS